MLEGTLVVNERPGKEQTTMAQRKTQSTKPRRDSATPSQRGNPVRPLFRIGPGLLLAIMVSAWLFRQLASKAGGEGLPLGIDRTRVDSTAPSRDAAPLLSSPDPDWLVAQETSLHLSEKQAARLHNLYLRWRRDTKTLRGALGQATVRFEQETAAIRGSGTSGTLNGTTLEAVQERARPVSEFSRQLAQARRAWWEEAAGILTPVQREQAEQGWAGRFFRPAARQRKNSDVTP